MGTLHQFPGNFCPSVPLVDEREQFVFAQSVAEHALEGGPTRFDELRSEYIKTEHEKTARISSLFEPVVEMPCDSGA